MNFNEAAVIAVFDAAISAVQKIAEFDVVISHEPKSAPVNLPACAVWVQELQPVAAVSGLGATSGRLGLAARVYLNFLAKPEDKIDRKLVTLTSLILGAFSGDFTLGQVVMEVDLLGAYGEALSAKAGYISHDDRMFRVMEISVPLIIDELWTQEA